MSKFAFLASNPSHAGPNSPAIINLRKWWSQMGIAGQVDFFNVSNQVTPGNRPLKRSEYELTRLACNLSGYIKIVALGTTASKALELLGRAHFRLPHPSPRNRQLNDHREIQSLLKSCMCYLGVDCYAHIDG